jgi:hypothetical protein
LFLSFNGGSNPRWQQCNARSGLGKKSGYMLGCHEVMLVVMLVEIDFKFIEFN